MHWHKYADEPLRTFTARAYQALQEEETRLPGKLALIAPRMAAQDWLGSYRNFAVMEQVVTAMSRRLSRPEGLAGGAIELERLYEPLQQDFHDFYPLLQAFAKQSTAAPT